MGGCGLVLEGHAQICLTVAANSTIARRACSPRRRERRRQRRGSPGRGRGARIRGFRSRVHHRQSCLTAPESTTPVGCCGLRGADMRDNRGRVWQLACLPGRQFPPGPRRAHPGMANYPSEESTHRRDAARAAATSQRRQYPPAAGFRARSFFTEPKWTRWYRTTPRRTTPAPNAQVSRGRQP